jgi:hypothetical protein
MTVFALRHRGERLLVYSAVSQALSIRHRSFAARVERRSNLKLAGAPGDMMTS